VKTRQTAEARQLPETAGPGLASFSSPPMGKDWARLGNFPFGNELPMLLNTGRALLTAIGSEGGIESQDYLPWRPALSHRSGHAGPFGRTKAVYARASGLPRRRGAHARALVTGRALRTRPCCPGGEDSVRRQRVSPRGVVGRRQGGLDVGCHRYLAPLRVTLDRRRHVDLVEGAALRRCAAVAGRPRA
jgi:hypothetical protein